MKARDDFKLSVLRMVKSAIQLKEVEKLRKLDEPESIQLLQTIFEAAARSPSTSSRKAIGRSWRKRNPEKPR